MPATVQSALKRIRAGVVAACRRAAGSLSSLPPISSRDLLEGTCLRFDTQDSGALGADKLQQVGGNKRHNSMTLIHRIMAATSRTDPSSLRVRVLHAN